MGNGLMTILYGMPVFPVYTYTLRGDWDSDFAPQFFLPSPRNIAVSAGLS